MKIAVIGAKGVVGSALVEHFLTLDHEVFSIDLDNTDCFEEAVRSVDVVFIVIMPIENVACLISRASKLMKPGSLLIHGTSIERPRSPNVIQVHEVIDKEITFCHLHTHFRPEKPLTRTLLGQHITLNVEGRKRKEWEQWVVEQFAPFEPLLDFLPRAEHDRITKVSQLVHMVFAFIVAKIWTELPKSTVKPAINLGGLPFRLLIRSVLRTTNGSAVVEGILFNHPQTLLLLDNIEKAVKKLRSIVTDRQSGEVVQSLKAIRDIFEPLDLKRWEKLTAELGRLEADFEKCNFVFDFGPEQNQVGLLGRILNEFDKRGVHKTTTIAQENPDGGCTIAIGVRDMNDGALEAERAVRDFFS